MVWLWLVATQNYKKSSHLPPKCSSVTFWSLFQEFETDPLFKKTSAQFDSGGGGGKFLCNLLTRDDGCQMLLDSEAIQVRCKWSLDDWTMLNKDLKYKMSTEDVRPL